ncbi:MAG: ABC transporter substrate-binding protein [Leptospiraceae bacterium]|nr:ABC transporter substrate-binding protein [Leptospiraceae bacterium]MCP5496229.1 ABC transporter substrate-binding protein [Leptospiraceae bacterium]
MKNLIFCCLCLLACSPNSQVTNTQDKVIMAIPSDPYSLDPIFATDLASQKLNLLVFKKLFRIGKNGKLENELTDKWTPISPNVIRISMKKLKASDGEFLTSDDVLYSLNRLKAEIGPRKSVYSFIQSINKLSQFALEIEFTGSLQAMQEKLSLPPASIYSKKHHSQKEKFVSSGLYSLEEWSKNNHIKLKKNEFLSDENLPKELELLVLPQATTSVYLFSRNKLDILKMPFFLLNHEATKQGKIKTVKSKSVQYVAINNKNPCFDKPFRKALNYAVHKDLIIEKIFESRASQPYTSIPPDYMLNQELTKKYVYPYNPQKAKNLIAQSKCYPAILQTNLDFRMRGDDENKSKGMAVVQYLKEIGLTVKVNPMEKVKLYKENGQNKGDLTFLTWYVDYDSVYNFIDPLFASDSYGNGGNRAFYQNDKIDSFILKVRKGELVAEQELVTTIEVLYENAPWIFLWSIYEDYLLSAKAQKYPELEEFIF